MAMILEDTPISMEGGFTHPSIYALSICLFFRLESQFWASPSPESLALVSRRVRRVQESGRRGILFELLDVVLFNLLHEGFAFEEVTVEFGGELTGDNEKLIVKDFGKRDRAARGNQVCAPLEHQAGVPEDE